MRRVVCSCRAADVDPGSRTESSPRTWIFKLMSHALLDLEWACGSEDNYNSVPTCKALPVPESKPSES